MPPDHDPRTLRGMFGRPIRPTISISSAEVALAAQTMAGTLSISGVQPKLSLRLEGERLVPVARDGQYILKPEPAEFPELPQNEHLCMTMGSRFGLRTAAFILLELADGAACYVVKRFDRVKRGRRLLKLPCEDMQQLLGGPDKYAGSHEELATALREHCTFAPLELQRLFEATLFNFAIGNGDAHRKNFSLLTDEQNTVALSPCYDVVSSRLALPAERDELALALNGKRNRLKRDDFLDFAAFCGVSHEYARRRIADLLALRAPFEELIESAPLAAKRRSSLREILGARLERLA
jgi:serine/threonine-protein kinase HipA